MVSATSKTKFKGHQQDHYWSERQRKVPLFTIFCPTALHSTHFCSLLPYSVLLFSTHFIQFYFSILATKTFWSGALEFVTWGWHKQKPNGNKSGMRKHRTPFLRIPLSCSQKYKKNSSSNYMSKKATIWRYEWQMSPPISSVPRQFIHLHSATQLDTLKIYKSVKLRQLFNKSLRVTPLEMFHCAIETLNASLMEHL